MYKDVHSRFLAKAESVPSGCVEWRSTLHRDGYGKFFFEGQQAPAHRVAYQIFVGAIPEGLWVLHKCDNRKCVNPDHLYLGDAKQNSRDRSDRKRYAVKVPIETVNEIKRMYATGEYSQQALEQLTGVKQSQISRYVRNQQRIYK